jgi:CHAT domain-containing protein
MDLVKRILTMPVEEIERTGHRPLYIIDLLRATAIETWSSHPDRAMQMWEKSYQVCLHTGGFEPLREQILKDGLALFEACYRRSRNKIEAEDDLSEIAQTLRGQSEDEHWTQQEYFDAVIALAIWGARTNREEAALYLLETLEGVPSTTAYGREHLTKYLRQILKICAAVNAIGRESFAAAALLYLNAVPALLELGLGAAVLDLLRRTQDLVSLLKSEEIIGVVCSFSLVALPAEDALGLSASEIIQDCCRSFVATIQMLTCRNPTDEALVDSATGMFCVWQVAKGLRFAATLRNTTRYNWQDDLEGRRILDRIVGLRDGLSADVLGPIIGIMDGETLLSSYIDHREPELGTDKRQVLSNLKRAYDSHITHKMLRHAEEWSDILQTPDDLRKQIGAHTVLLIYFLGLSPDDDIVLYAIMLTRESTVTVCHELSDEARVFLTSGTQERTIKTRAAIQEKPQNRHTMSRRAQKILRSVTEAYIGTSLRKLLGESWDKGKYHLCISPHGALHFFPFHLLELDGAPLGASWIVTYLPNLQLLSRETADDRKPCINELAAFGLNFEAPCIPAMPSIPWAPDEAQRIAALYGVTAVTNSAATRAALLEALQTSKRIHIATHGRHQPDAPAFQCIYVADASGYIPVHAYELLGLDLRNVDLLTLSACETALGRFDIGDNLRGLPASFFICGVKTIVGTLWEVSDNAAATFFTSFYRTLHEGSSKLAAFAEAQRQTRSRFPQYRDWGCFYMAGSIS